MLTAVNHLIIALICLFTCVCLCAGEYHVNNKMQNVLQTIPKSDQLEIQNLFRELFKEDNFAYSLYGDKPMSMSDYTLNRLPISELFEIFPSIEKFCKELLEIYIEPRGFKINRWVIWKKYRDRFPMNKYTILEKEIGDQSRIFLINNDAFRNVVNQNIDLFKAIIGTEISAELLLSQFKLANNNVFDILHNNVALLGILLGFGRHNAILFQKREALLNHFEMTKGLYNATLIEKKIKASNDSLQTLREYDFFGWPLIINRVCFAAEAKHAETLQLRAKYDQLNVYINNIYFKEDWFEQTLDFFRNYIYLLKLPFLASLILNFSGLVANMLLKFVIKSAQKKSIFPKKANFERSLLLKLTSG